MNKNWGPPATYTEAENLTPEKIEEARQALERLIKTMAHMAVEASIKHKIELDMNDPEVAREVMKATFDALFGLKPEPTPRKSRKQLKAVGTDVEKT